MLFHSFSKGSALSLLFASHTIAQNCVLTLPANPLTAQGLMTPYTVTGCDQRQFACMGSFAEAVIYDPATASITAYHPLVVNQGDVAGKDFLPPANVTVPAGATVAIYFGSNALTLTLAGAGAASCTNGFDGSIFGQVASCGGENFMQVTQAAISAGTLVPPALGTATNGNNVGPCLVTRDFRMVDMDQSDNVDTIYLLINNKVLAQATSANVAANPGAQNVTNASDNALLTYFLDPALGCTPWMVQSVTAPGGMCPTQATNELLAFKNPPTANGGPALVPLNDDMTVINNGNTVTQSLGKTNAYRAIMGQTPAASITDASGLTYCTKYAISGIFIADNEALFAGHTSPMPGTASNLFTFMANRFFQSFGPVPALGCNDTFGIPNPVTVTMNGNCVVTAATINTTALQDILDGKISAVATTATTAAAGASAAANATATASGVIASATGKGGGKGGAGGAAGAGSASPASAPAASATAGGAGGAGAAGQPIPVNPAQATVVYGKPGSGRNHYKRRYHARDVRQMKARQAAADIAAMGFLER